MKVTIGTFNLNNLFSRYNFQGEVDAIREGETTVDSKVRYDFEDGDLFRLRTFKGRLVKAKDPRDVLAVVSRVKEMDLDVLAVQEVEDIDTLREFARKQLDGQYPYQALIEGNDPRLIDLGVLSKFPIGAITSWQYAVHPDVPNEPIFGRDLQEVEILDRDRDRTLFTIYNNHLKSHYVPFDQDQVEGARLANEKRRREAQTVERILRARARPDGRFVVLGDMNDPPDSEWLEPLVASTLGLANALTNPEETRPPKPDVPPPATKAWTHRFKPANRPAQYELFDQIWLSPSLAERFDKAFIDRRTKHSGDGSDHDPAWVELDL